MQFSHLCKLVITYLIETKFAAEMSGVYIPNLKKNTQDTSNQNFVYISSFFFYISQTLQIKP